MIPYIYDIALAVILIAFIGMGYRRGVLRTVLSLICMVIAFSVAAACSSYPVCSDIYDKYFSDMISKHIETAVEDFRIQAEEKLREEAEKSAESFVDEHFGGSEEIKALINQYLNTDSAELREQISAAAELTGFDVGDLLTNPEFRDKIKDVASEYSSKAAEAINSRLPLGIKVKSEAVEAVLTDEEAAEAVIYDVFGLKPEGSDTSGTAGYIEKKIVRPAAIRLISAVLWAAVLSAVNIILKIIVRIILIVRKIEPVRACDSLLGGVLGGALGAAVAAACLILIILIIRVTGGMTYLNEDIFADTYVFGRLYDMMNNII